MWTLLRFGLFQDALENCVRNLAQERTSAVDSSPDLLCLLVFQKDATTVSARRGQKVLDDFRELYVNYRNCKLDVAEMAWTSDSSVAARFASLPRFKCTQSAIHQTGSYRSTILVIGVGGLYLGDRKLPQLLRRKKSKAKLIDYLVGNFFKRRF